MIDGAGADIGDRLEPSVGVRRKSGDRAAVIHVPTVDVGEVLPDLATGQRRIGPELGGAGRVVVAMVRTEEERIDRRPLHTEIEGLAHEFGHLPIVEIA